MGSSEVWCWRRMEKIIWTDRAINDVLRMVMEGKNMLQTVKKWIDHILHRNRFLKQVIEGTVLGGNDGKMRKKT
jgi:hypothetical protein